MRFSIVAPSGNELERIRSFRASVIGGRFEKTNSLGGRVLFAATQSNHENKVRRWATILSILFSWLALINVLTFVVIEYGIVGKNPQWDKGEFRSPLADIIHSPQLLLGSAAISDAERCFASFALLDVDLQDFDSYDKFVREDSSVTVAQAGVYYGIEGIREYLEYASDLNVLFTKWTVTESETKFEEYDSTTGLCKFLRHRLSRVNFDPETTLGGGITADVATTYLVTYDLNQDYVKSIEVFLTKELIFALYARVVNVEAMSDNICSIMSNTCNMSDSQCTEKMSQLPPVEGENSYIDGNSLGCRMVHSMLALNRPQIHCPHLSFTPMPDLFGDIKCQESSGYLPGDLFSSKQIESREKFLLELGINPSFGYRVTECKGNCSFIPEGALELSESHPAGEWKATDSFFSHLDPEEFRVYLGFVIWITVLFAGIGSELLFFLFLLERKGWGKELDSAWKLSQFLFPLLAVVSLGLATSQNYLTLPVLVIGLWKCGFPETIMHMHAALVDEKGSRLEKISSLLNALGTVSHHGAGSMIICMLLTGVIFPDQHVLSSILILVMQHWVVLLKYVNPSLYALLQTFLEVIFEWVLLSEFQYIIANHWTASMAAGVMLVSHWFYFVAAGLVKIDKWRDGESEVNLSDVEAEGIIEKSFNETVE